MNIQNRIKIEEFIIDNKIALNIQKRKQKKKKFKLLNLRNHKTPIITLGSKQMIQKLNHIKVLNFSQCGLIDIKNLPFLPNLQKLDLTMNKIQDSQIIYLLNTKNIRLLYLTQNFIQNYHSLSILNQMVNLKQIDISSNPCNYIPNDIFILLPNLTIVDRYLSGGEDLQDYDYDGYSSQSSISDMQSQQSQIQFTQKEMQECIEEKYKSSRLEQISESEISNLSQSNEFYKCFFN